MRLSIQGICLFLGLILTSSAYASEPPSVFIEELTTSEVKAAIARGMTTAIFYAGSTEQNGPHMVIGKHNFIARRAAGEIASRLGDALVYPVLPFAPTGDALRRTGHMAYPGSVTIDPVTYTRVAREVAQSARAAGFSTILIMADHGDGQSALAELAAELDREWKTQGARALYIGDLYYRTLELESAYLKSRGLDAGGHGGLADAAVLM